MSATSSTGLGVDAMSKEQYKNERVYLMTMSFAKKMLNKGVISEDQYHDFDTKMQQKYAPTFSILFTDINLDKP